MTVKLKPCPFCGGVAVLEELYDSKGGWTVYCSNIHCRLKVQTDRIRTEEIAIEIWNTRAKQD